jgi:hypothetical protein
VRKAIGAVLFGGVALVVLYDWAGIGGGNLDVAVNSVVYDAVVVCAGLGCLTRARRGGSERGAWLAIGGAILAWAAGEIWWTAYIENAASPPYPSPADIGYIAFYRWRSSASGCWSGRVPSGSTGGCGWTGRSPRSAPPRSAQPC